MCGIAGQFFHLNQSPKQEVLERMSEQLIARGPDDLGLYINNHIGLVHRRLSIRDLSDKGKCPMSTSNGRYVLVFNGEIYNWRELKTELINLEYSFFSNSDTEVILNGFDCWGINLFRKLRGMFAIAIWDCENTKLVLARDLAGEKPLFYKFNQSGLVFSSSINSLQESEMRSNLINNDGLLSHLSFSFIPSKLSIWEGIQILQPAHFLEIETGSIPTIHQYWEFPDNKPIKQTIKICETKIDNSLKDSVKRCLDADVPVGVFLSGGVDSSLIAAYAKQFNPKIKAFSVDFEENTHSEIRFASKVANHLNIDHYVKTLKVDDAIEFLPYLVKQYGQPFGDASAVPTYFVSKMAREHVKVCLSGDGGDESFGGYPRLSSIYYSSLYKKNILPFIGNKLLPVFANNLGRFGSRLNSFNQLVLQDPFKAYNNNQSWYNNLTEIAGPKLNILDKVQLKNLRLGGNMLNSNLSLIQKILYDDFKTQLPDAYLTKVDVASMAASLEVRAPFLDKQIIELAWTMPDKTKLNMGQRKWLLKKIAANYVPRDVIYRPKMGFAMPLQKWFTGQMGEYYESQLNYSIAAREGWINKSVAMQTLQKHKNGNNESTKLWLILWLELWFKWQESIRS